MRLRLDVAADLAEEDIVRAAFANLERLMAVADATGATISVRSEFLDRLGKVGGGAVDVEASALARPAIRLSPAMSAAAPAPEITGTSVSA